MSNDEQTSEPEDQVEALAEQYLRSLRAGTPLDRVTLAASRLDLAPDLDKRLAVVELMHAAVLAARSPASLAPPIPERSDDVPSTVGRFEVLSLLGRGSFGAVYKARDPELNRIVAVKVPRAGYFNTREQEERFLREARNGAALKHPGIVQVHEICHVEGLPFIVSEVIEGQTLAALLASRRLDVHEAARLVALIACALDHAHGQKVVHRDVKPANIIVDPEGRPHVTDFGLARRDEGDATVTLEGQILGTPAYMSPEQARGDRAAIGPRSDVYSLGVILYECLTGERPFRGDRSTVIEQVLRDEPRPLRVLDERVPLDLDTVCLKAMAKDRARRYETARGFADDIFRWLNGEPVQARRTTAVERLWRWARRNPAVAGLSAAVVLVLAGAALFGSLLAIRAEHARQAATRRLTHLNVTTGMRLAEGNDPLGALPWLAEALQLEGGDPERAEAHRLRFAAVLDQCPRLTHVWFNASSVSQVELDARSSRVLWCAGGRAWVADLNPGGAPAVQLDHDGGVAHAAISPGGGLIATAGASGTACVWKADSRAPALPPLRHQKSVAHVAFSPNERLLATASHDRTARLWDTLTGEPVGEPLHHDGPVLHAAFSPDSRWIVTASADRTVAVWDAGSGRPASGKLRCPGEVHEAWFSPKGPRILAVHDNAVTVFDSTSGKRISSGIRHAGRIHHAAFSPDGLRVLTASQDATAAVWDAETGRSVGTPIQHALGVASASFSTEGSRFVTASFDATARFWDTATGHEVLPPLYHGNGLVAAQFSPDGRLVVTGGHDNSVRVWDLAGLAPSTVIMDHGSALGWASFSRDGTRWITASASGALRVWRREGRAPDVVLSHGGVVSFAEISPDGGRAISVGPDGSARVWDTVTSKVAAELACSSGIVHAAFSPDGRRLATACRDGTAFVWRAETGERLAGPFRHQGAVNRVAFSPDGLRIATASDDATARVWEAASGKPVLAPFEHNHRDVRRVVWVAFSLDGRRVVTASSDETAGIWDTTASGSAPIFLRHTADVVSAEISPNGRLVATASVDATARIWDAATGAPLTVPLHHQSHVKRATFSLDSRFLLTASADGGVRIWDAAAGELITPAIRHEGPVECAVFSPDGRSILTASADGTARLWELPSRAHTAESSKLWACMLSHQRVDTTGGSVRASLAEVRAAWQVLTDREIGDFRAEPEELISWHFQQASARSREGAWAHAARHLDAIIALRPQDFGFRKRRALAHAELDDLEKAAGDYEAALALGSGDINDGYNAALTHLASGDLESYRRACDDLLARSAGMEATARTATNVALACVLAPGRTASHPAVLGMAQRLMSLQPQAAWSHIILGAALHRAGQSAQAVPVLKRAIELSGNGGEPLAHCFLPMALDDLGEKESARRELRTAEAVCSRYFQPAADAGPGTAVPWWRRVRVQLILGEAEARLGFRPTPAQGGSGFLDRLSRAFLRAQAPWDHPAEQPPVTPAIPATELEGSDGE